MRKWLMMIVGACMLVLASGCSQTSQAAGQQQPASDHQKQTDGSKNVNSDKKQGKDQKKEAFNGPISDFNWQSYQNQHDQQAKTKNTAKTTSDSNSEKGIVPVKIKIPAINVKTDVIKKGIVQEGKYKGHMATPDNAVQTAWFKYGPKPGEKGSAIIAGHVDTYKGPGVFFNLEDLKKGDKVYITGKNGKTLTFKVFKKKAYPREGAPVFKVFGYTPARIVRLLTCTGTFDQAADTHNERLVVSAVLVQNDGQNS